MDMMWVAANVIEEINQAVNLAGVQKHHLFLQTLSFIQTLSLKKGPKKFGQKGHDAAFGEMKQLQDRHCFVPIDVAQLTMTERKWALECLIFLVEKRDGRIKARMCTNRSVEFAWTAKDNAASPIAMTESTANGSSRCKGGMRCCNSRYPQCIHTNMHPQWGR